MPTSIGIDGDGRGPDRFVVADEGDPWAVEQILVDSEGHDEWHLEVTSDLPASVEAGPDVHVDGRGWAQRRSHLHQAGGTRRSASKPRGPAAAGAWP